MNWIHVLLCCNFDVVGTFLGNLRDEQIESLKSKFCCHLWGSNSSPSEVIAMDVKLIMQLLEEMTAIYTEEKKTTGWSPGTVWWTRSGVCEFNDLTGTTWKENGLCQDLRHFLPLARSNASSRTISQLNQRAREWKRETIKRKQWEPISIFTSCKSFCETDNWVKVSYC